MIVDRDGMAVLVWTPFTEAASPPRFHHRKRKSELSTEQVDVIVFLNGWCTGELLRNDLLDLAKRKGLRL